MEERPLKRGTKRAAASGCPNCGASLAKKVNGVRPLYSECPFCRTKIIEVWWQRLLWVSLGLFLTWAFPEALGLRGWTVLFLAPILLFPCFVLSMHLIMSVMPVKYVRQEQDILTLLHR